MNERNLLHKENEDNTGSAVTSSSRLWKSHRKLQVCDLVAATSHVVVQDNNVTTYKQTAVLEVDGACKKGWK